MEETEGGSMGLFSGRKKQGWVARRSPEEEIERTLCPIRMHWIRWRHSVNKVVVTVGRVTRIDTCVEPLLWYEMWALAGSLSARRMGMCDVL